LGKKIPSPHLVVSWLRKVNHSRCNIQLKEYCSTLPVLLVRFFCDKAPAEEDELLEGMSFLQSLWTKRGQTNLTWDHVSSFTLISFSLV